MEPLTRAGRSIILRTIGAVCDPRDFDYGYSRRLLETDDEPENCKCDPYCRKWGDCCNACAKAMEESHPSAFFSQEELEIFGPIRSSMSEEEYEKAYEDFLQSEITEDFEQVSLGVKNKELKKTHAELQKLLLDLSKN